MRILICYPWLELGGAPKTSITLAKGLKERGHDVYFFSKQGGMYRELLEKAEIPLISAPHHPFIPNLYHLNLRAYRILKKTVEDYGIDIIHAFHPNLYFLSLFLAPWKDIPVVLTAVWYLDEFPFPTYPGTIIYVAEEFKDQSAPFTSKYARERVVIPNRVDLDRFSKEVDSSDFATEHSLPSGGTKIAFMSRLGHTKEKSIFYAMDAIDILAGRGFNVTLVIAGDGPSYKKLSEYGEKLNRKHPDKPVRFLGRTSRTPELLSWSDIVLGIGRCAFEGMAAGRPTLVVGEKGLAGVVSREKAAELQYYNFAGRNIKEKNSPELLADKLQEIVEDRSKYLELASFSGQYVKKNYGYREGAARLEKIYERCLNSKELTLYEKMRTLITNFLYGYGRRVYIACRGKLAERVRGE